MNILSSLLKLFLNNNEKNSSTNVSEQLFALEQRIENLEYKAGFKGSRASYENLSEGNWAIYQRKQEKIRFMPIKKNISISFIPKNDKILKDFMSEYNINYNLINDYRKKVGNSNLPSDINRFKLDLFYDDNYLNLVSFTGKIEDIKYLPFQFESEYKKVESKIVSYRDDTYRIPSCLSFPSNEGVDHHFGANLHNCADGNIYIQTKFLDKYLLSLPIKHLLSFFTELFKLHYIENDEKWNIGYNYCIIKKFPKEIQESLNICGLSYSADKNRMVDFEYEAINDENTKSKVFKGISNPRLSLIGYDSFSNFELYDKPAGMIADSYINETFQSFESAYFDIQIRFEFETPPY